MMEYWNIGIMGGKAVAPTTFLSCSNAAIAAMVWIKEAAVFHHSTIPIFHLNFTE
jgi:hypothetical protein